MDREAPFVGLPRGGQDAEGEVAHGAAHFFLAPAGLELVALSRELGGAAASLFSARFSLMDLPDFLDAA
jgi:hypothetical protein